MAWFPTSSPCWLAHTWTTRKGSLFYSPWATALRLQVRLHMRGSSCIIISAYVEVCFNYNFIHSYSLFQSSFPWEYNLSIYLIHVGFTTLCFFLSIEEHQFQLVQCGGLPLIITLLTEDTSEEVRKAATFILQTCKQASKSSSWLHRSG